MQWNFTPSPLSYPVVNDHPSPDYSLITLLLFKQPNWNCGLSGQLKPLSAWFRSRKRTSFWGRRAPCYRRHRRRSRPPLQLVPCLPFLLPPSPLPSPPRAHFGRMSVALLLQLAAEFEAQGAYVEAVKCLTPVSNASSELPAVVGQASLKLARLLLAHFDNVQEAKSILLKAVRRWRGRMGDSCIAGPFQPGLQAGGVANQLKNATIPPPPAARCPRRPSCGRHRVTTCSSAKSGTRFHAATSAWAPWRRRGGLLRRGSGHAAKAPHPRTGEEAGFMTFFRTCMNGC